MFVYLFIFQSVMMLDLILSILCAIQPDSAVCVVTSVRLFIVYFTRFKCVWGLACLVSLVLSPAAVVFYFIYA